MVSHTNYDDSQGIQQLEVLLKWFQKHHVWYDESKIKVEVTKCSPLPELSSQSSPSQLTNGIQFSIRSLTDISKDEIVAKIPKESTLSWRTGGISNLIDEAEIRGPLALAITLLYELQQGENSPWYGYLQSLPIYAPLPCTWSLKELKFLEPLGSYSRILETKSDISEDFDFISDFLDLHPEVFDKNFFTEINFLRASTLVSSRAFQIDDYHGDAMVPFADLFNHRSGTEHVHFETDENICNKCGDSENCCHEDESEHEMDSEDEASDDDTASVSSENSHISPVSSPPVGLDSITLKELKDPSEKSLSPCPLNGRGDELECYDCDVTHTEKNIIEMRLIRSVQQNEEVFNTYGQRDNQSILERYGFVELENQNDCVFFPKKSVMEACSDDLGYSSEEVIKRYNTWIYYWKLISQAEIKLEQEKNQEDSDSGKEHDDSHDGSESYEESDDCLYCGQEHGVEGEHIDSIAEATSLCPFYGDEKLEGESDDNYHRRKLERSILFDKLEPHLFRINSEGVPSSPFLVFLNVVALSNKSFKVLKNSEDEEVLEYLKSYLDNWKDNSVIPPRKKKRGLLAEAVPVQAINRLLKYLTDSRLSKIAALLPDDSFLEDEKTKSQLPRLYFALLACYSERTILQKHLSML